MTEQKSGCKYWGKARKECEIGAPYHLLAYHRLDVAVVGYEYLILLC
jgi:CRISPR-associated endonuclease/helicase Cas3